MAFQSLSTTSPRIAAGDPVFSSKFRKFVKAGGPWFESGQRTFVELDKFKIKFRFSGLFVAITYFLMQKGTKKSEKRNFMMNLLSFKNVSSDRIQTTDPQFSRLF